MLEILQFIFSSFWIWLGCVILLYVGGYLLVALVSAIIADTRGANVTINGPYGARCTLELKKRVRQKWECENGIGHTYVWGYDVNEKHRAERLVESMPEFKHEFPLIDLGLTKVECHDMCMQLGLKRPAMYDLGYPNNNCIGCVKGGMGYWNKIRRDFPEVFERRAGQEREIGHSCIKGVYLDELDPERGNMNTEVFPECGIACYIALTTEERSIT